MTEAKRVSELDLLAYADGRLDDDPGRKAEVEAALAADPEARERAEAFRAQTEALRAAYDWRLAEPVPERMTWALEGSRRSRSGMALRAAAVALLTVGAGTAGWLLGPEIAPEGPGPAGKLAELSYGKFIAGHPDETATALGAAAGTVRPMGWLADEVSMRIKTPDLSGDGYRLVDKESVTADGRQLVRLDYAAGDGRLFSLFLAPRWEERQVGIAQAERDGVSMAYWLDGPLASTVVTRMPPAETRHVAEAVREAMHANGDVPAVMESEPGGKGVPGKGLMADSATMPTVDASPQVPQTVKPAQRQVQPN